MDDAAPPTRKQAARMAEWCVRWSNTRAVNARRYFKEDEENEMAPIRGGGWHQMCAHIYMKEDYMRHHAISAPDDTMLRRQIARAIRRPLARRESTTISWNTVTSASPVCFHALSLIHI